MKALFLYDPQDLSSAIPGGVQLCSQQFLTIVSALSGEAELMPVYPDRSLLVRLRRRFRLGTYLGYNTDRAVELRLTLLGKGITHLFINRAELLRFARCAKESSPTIRTILMSHGNQSGDDLYELAGPAGRVSRFQRGPATWKLGLDLRTEASIRHRWIDAVAVMSAEEACLERWLGARSTVTLPRLIEIAPLVLRPVPRRAGYVGTLDHTPNRVGLEQVCGELQRRAALDIELRLVGSPASVGFDLARRFSFVKYVGKLPPEDLRDEAASWSLMLNPVLWLSRGASMKLGIALGWGMPVLTTRSGARGYEWREGGVEISADTASDFAAMVLRLLSDPARLQHARERVRRAAATGPTVQELAERLRQVC